MPDRVGQSLGNYRLVRLLGRGGFAEVYLGEHQRLGSHAAIKILYAHAHGADEDEFLAEARTIARLVHPHIVRILDFNTEEGTPFLVMDYASNGNLRQRHPKGTRLPVETVSEYIKQVADALQYAHDEKVIHRDIKPENMLVGRRSEIFLSDFGIALIAQSSRLQSTQEVVGTAIYMAPEQLQGKPRLASDQYALGIVIYEWLTGDRPFHGGFVELYSQHLSVPPPPLRSKVPDLSPDLERVVLTALAKDPAQRFGSIKAFANAFEQAINRPPSIIKPSVSDDMIARNAASPVVPPTPVARQDVPYFPLPSAPIANQPGMPNSPMPVVDMPPQVNPYMTSRTPPTRLSSETSFETPPQNQVPSPLKKEISGASKRGISRRGVIIGVAAVVVAGGAGAWLLYQQSQTKVPEGTLLYKYQGHSDSVNAVAWVPDGSRIASASNDHTVQIWNASNGGSPFTYRQHSTAVNAMAWSPDGKYIASASNTTVLLWSAADGSTSRIYKGHSYYVHGLAWSPDSKRIASGSDDGIIQVWNAGDESSALVYKGHTNSVSVIAWSPDGIHIASGGMDNTVKIWNPSDGSTLRTYTGHPNFVYALAWSPDSTRIASGGLDDTVRVWDIAGGVTSYIYNDLSNSANSLAWSPDGMYIAASSGGNAVHVWHAVDGAFAYIYSGHSGPVNSVAWSPDSKYIASGSDDTTVQIWGGP